MTFTAVTSPAVGDPTAASFGVTVATDLTDLDTRATTLDTRATTLETPPLFIGHQASAQSIPNNAFTPITWDIEDVDSHNGHSIATNTSRYVAQRAGWYLVTCRAGTSGTATGKRIISISVNGTLLWNNELDPPGTGLVHNAITAVVSLAVGDYVEGQFFQTSGAALSLNATAAYYPSMSVAWLRKP